MRLGTAGVSTHARHEGDPVRPGADESPQNITGRCSEREEAQTSAGCSGFCLQCRDGAPVTLGGLSTEHPLSHPPPVENTLKMALLRQSALW